MLKRAVTGTLLTLATLCAPADARAAALDTRFFASDAKGDEFPPAYVLRMDGALGGTDVVTFHEHGLLLDLFDDGSARLFGELILGEGPDLIGSVWDLDVHWDSAGATQAEQFFHLASGTLRSRAEPENDLFDLVHRGHDGVLGVGVFPDRKCLTTGMQAPCMGFAAWLAWEHFVNGEVVHSWASQGRTSDFIMEVLPIPEPAAGLLLGAALLSLAAVGGWQRVLRA